MTSFRERVNSHLPIVLQFLSTISLISIALTAICGTNSLKKMAESHSIHIEELGGTNHSINKKATHNH